MKKTSRKKLIIVIIAIVLIISGGAFFALNSGSPAPSYATEPVRRGDIENSVLANGMLQASKLVSVGAQASGQIINLPVTLGQLVKQGELIAQIDSLTQQNTLKEAIASLTSNKAEYRAKQAQINQAQQEFDRQKAMLADNASSKADYESAQASLLVYQAELDQLMAQQEQVKLSVESAQLDLGYTTIKAPMDGIVVYTAVTVGQTVNSSQSTPTIVELADLSQMTVKAQISEADVIKVKPGQSVYFTILGQPQKRFHATLRAIEPGPTIMDGDDSDMTSSDTDAIYYNGLFDVDNPDGVLRIGMTAEVSIILNQAKDVIVVPSQILQRNPGPRPSYSVPVLVNDEIEYRNVSVGINNKVNAEITEGLEEGDQIVLGAASSDTVSNQRGNRRPPMGF
ncbi:efflux RND transporter periplasmic adaptor subunit [Shewanella saliphila]|uniref:Hemolysin secretion protein D n=1 Tax=Shewanella saliphila TaxID=2282698 RepID=A0ABQ2Q728_9GAMM|nr:efflux RND transporter periplasmic adaptor subunit [Shewanella saliphila]MCL1100892.1 efflux RND transporter periplasmic adaptor subunit [Shewanella saliphila]GGP57920.1 hemolysin secretion protein D [Shewanella saliphila]